MRSREGERDRWKDRDTTDPGMKGTMWRQSKRERTSVLSWLELLGRNKAAKSHMNYKLSNK